MEDYQAYKAKYGELFDAQILLEDEAKSMAEERMRLALEEVRRNGEAGEGKLAGRFIESAWQTCRANIRALLASASRPNKTIQGLWVAPMKDLIRIYQGKPGELENLLVLTSLSVTISMVMFPSAPYKKTVSNIAGLIGNAIRQEAEIESFFVWSAAKGDVKDSWLRNSMDNGIAKRVRSSYRIAYAVHRMHAQGYSGLKWDKQSCVAFGAKILEMVVKGSAYFEMVDQYIDKKKIKSLVASKWFEKAWENNENRLVETAIKYTPTIIPPKPWTTPYDGGYYGAATLGVNLIRLKEVVQTKELREYTRKLGAVDLSNIYSVLNHMQETPFIINKRILQILKEIYASGGELGGIPRTSPYATLPKLPDDVDMDVLKEHKRKQVAIHLQESARKSRALRAYIALKTAEKFAEYEKIYFPWNIDYRGRCYPIPTAISPQGDDIQKALLLFAEPSPLASDADRIGGALVRMSDWIHNLGKITSTLNMLPKMTESMYRHFRTSYIADAVAYAHGFKTFSSVRNPFTKAKLKASNITPEKFDNIMENLRKYTKVDEKGNIIGNDWKAWRENDPQSYFQFYGMTQTHAERAIVSGTKQGNKNLMKANSWIYRTLLQFKDYNLRAISGQTMRALTARDLDDAIAFGMSMATNTAAFMLRAGFKGALMYAAGNATGANDYLKQQFDEGQLLRVAALRSAMASPLSFFNDAWEAGTGVPTIRTTVDRSTRAPKDQDAKDKFGNAVAQLPAIQELLAPVTAGIGAAGFMNGEGAQKDVRRLYNVLPIPRFIPFMTYIDSLVKNSGVPEKRPKTQ